MLITDLPRVERKTFLEFPQVIVKRKKAFNLKTEAEKVAQWKAIDRTRNRWILSISRIVKSVFKAELKVLKKSASNALTPSGLMDSVLDDVERNGDDWENLLKDIYLPVSRDIAGDVVDGLKHTHPKEFKAMTGAEESFVDPFVLDYLEKQSSTKVVGLLGETTKRLRRVLSAGVAEGESVSQLSKRIDDLYLEQIIPNRSEVIARTETIQASNLGSFAGAKATQIPGLKKVWLTTRDTRARDTHLDIDGEREEIDAPFVLASGSQLMFPVDSSLGAAAGDVINCRCTQFFEGEDDI